MAPLNRVTSWGYPSVMAAPISSPGVLAPRTFTPAVFSTITDTLVCVIEVSSSDAVVDYTVSRSFSGQLSTHESTVNPVTTIICSAPISTNVDKPSATAPSSNAPSAAPSPAAITGSAPIASVTPAATIASVIPPPVNNNGLATLEPQLLPHASQPDSLTTIVISFPTLTTTNSQGLSTTLFSTTISTSTIAHPAPSGLNAGPSTSSQASAHPHAKIGAIVGGVLGGLVVLAAVFGCFLLIRKRSRSQRQARELNTSIDALAFLPIPGLGSDGVRSMSEIGAPRNASAPFSARFVRALSGKGREAHSVPVIKQPSTDRPAEVYVHSDGGRAPGEDNSGPEELPPTYDSIKGQGHKV